MRCSTDLVAEYVEGVLDHVQGEGGLGDAHRRHLELLLLHHYELLFMFTRLLVVVLINKEIFNQCRL